MIHNYIKHRIKDIFYCIIAIIIIDVVLMSPGMVYAHLTFNSHRTMYMSAIISYGSISAAILFFLISIGVLLYDPIRKDYLSYKEAKP